MVKETGGVCRDGAQEVSVIHWLMSHRTLDEILHRREGGGGREGGRGLGREAGREGGRQGGREGGRE